VHCIRFQAPAAVCKSILDTTNYLLYISITFVDLICSRDFFREKSLDIMYEHVCYDSMHDAMC
jgi:hypothetical protein